MRMIAFIEDPLVPKRILAHLGMPTRPPPRRPKGRLVEPPLDDQPDRFDGVDPPAADHG